MQATFDISLSLDFKLLPLSADESAAHAKALTKARHHQKSEAELLEAILEVDALKVYAKLGLTSMFAYCTDHLRLTEHSAFYFINVARKSRVVPELKTAIDRGELSVAKATKIVSVLTPSNQGEWIAKAKTLSKAQLESEVAEVSPIKKARSKLKPVGANRNKLECELTDETMRDFKRAQDLEAQRTGTHQPLEETLASVLKFYVERNDPVKKAERAARRRAAQSESPAATQSESPSAARPEPPPAVQPHSPSKDSAHSSREERRPIPAPVERAVHLRDQGKCRARLPDGRVCLGSRWTEIHHIAGVARGGGNDIDNLITLCGTHHRQWHRQAARLGHL